MYIYKAAIVGGGTMGAEIAQTISFSGLPVVIKDINQEMVDKSIATVRKIYENRVAKGKMTQDEVESKMSLVSGTTDYAGFSDVDIVIEAVPEKMELKKQIFKELDEATPETAILASNTSSLSISAFGSATQRPEKVVGMHFFYPAHVMKLVEVIPGLDTSDETVQDVIGFAESLRKLPVRVNECAGFLVNRILMPYLNEAAFCLQEGAANPKAVDEAIVEFGFPMGPFTLVDNLGFDVCREVVNVLLDAYGPRMAPAELWQKLAELNRLGVKSGAGFYLYGDRAGEEDAELTQLLEAQQKEHPRTEFSVERLIFAMLNECIHCLNENVCTAADLDLSVIAGLGYPPEKGGLLHYADEIGLDTVLEGLNKLAAEYGERFWPSPLLKRKVAAGHLGKKAKKGFFDYTD